MRALLEAAAAAVADEDLDQVRVAMKTANDQMNELEAIRDLGANIERRLVDMVGQGQAVQTELAVAPDDPQRLIRDMRLYVDGSVHRNLGSASLGTLNVLYLALLELRLDVRLLDSEIAHVVTAIEEPEAHLHPHLQRLIFRRILRAREGAYTALVTTHSPYIASVADPRSLVVLRRTDLGTIAASASTANLSEKEWDDVSRYIDATRAELVFARRVLLVEGLAEKIMIPSLAAALGLDLDQEGITICAIDGTHFTTYASLCDALGMPWAIVTDGDLRDGGTRAGDVRVAELIQALGLEGAPADVGIFVGDQTFEFDLISVDDGSRLSCFAALSELCAEPSRRVIESWAGQRPSYEDFMKVVTNAGGKGRFAQRLAGQAIVPPNYVEAALRYLVRQ